MRLRHHIIELIFILLVPYQVNAFCFDEAAFRYGLDPILLKGIAQVESRMNPYAIGKNTDGSYDYGLMQINSSWAPTLKRLGIPWESLSDPCTNIMVGAWILRQKIQRHGYNWKGIAAYHSATPSLNSTYANKLAREIRNLN